MAMQMGLLNHCQRYFSSFKGIYCFAFLMRLILILYSQWHDSRMDIKFTDVDYYVFTDAAEFVTLGESPYYRGTYRYSPLLAWALTPNIYLFASWGKVLFVICDLISALLIQVLLANAERRLAKLAVGFWLFNPVTAAVSCRGNAESIMSMLVLSVLYFLKIKRFCIAGLLFGLAAHLKIYPIVYSLGLYLYIDGNVGYLDSFRSLLKRDWSKITKCFITPAKIKFFGSAFVAFIGLTASMYHWYQSDFLEHTYLYHVKRKDIRHNFSVYFYMLYLNSTSMFGLVSFFIQFLVVVIVSVCFYADLEFCLFLLTYAFVTFNKICTSQYFLWYLSLAPLLVKNLASLTLKEVSAVALAWFSGQAIWLTFAGQLEFMGINSLFYVWLACCLFFVINVAIMCFFIFKHSPQFLKHGNVKLD